MAVNSAKRGVGTWIPNSKVEHPEGDHDHECYDCVLCCIDKLQRTLKLIQELQDLNKSLDLKIPNKVAIQKVHEIKPPEYAQGAARAHINK